MSGCKAHYSGGQMVCDHCGLVWDRDDDPPDCKLMIVEVYPNVSIDSIDVTIKIERDKPGDHDEEMHKIKEVLSDENNGS